MSNAMPYCKWYPRDWLGDPLLRMMSPADKGVWIDLLSVMMMAEPYGHLAVNGRAMTDEEAARLIGTDIGTYKGCVGNLISAGIPSFTHDGTMFSRRLVRDHARYMKASESGHKGGGNPKLKKKNPESRSQKPEATQPIKVPYIDTYIGTSGTCSTDVDGKGEGNPKPRNFEMDALSEADGGPNGVPSATWRRIAKALSDIRTASPDVTPEEIRRRIANYRTHYPDCACTSTAISKHWALCAAAKNPSAQPELDRYGKPVYASGETPEAYRARITEELCDTLRAQLLTWQTAGRWDEGFNAASSRTAAIKIHGQIAGPAFDRVLSELNYKAQKGAEVC